jgi:hypothetical protein
MNLSAAQTVALEAALSRNADASVWLHKQRSLKNKYVRVVGDAPFACDPGLDAATLVGYSRLTENERIYHDVLPEAQHLI